MIIKCAKRKHSSVLCTCPPTFRSLFLQTVVFTFLSVRSSAGKRLAVNEWMWDKNVEPSTCLQVVWANGKRFVFCMSCAKHYRALLRPEIKVSLAVFTTCFRIRTVPGASGKNVWNDNESDKKLQQHAATQSSTLRILLLMRWAQIPIAIDIALPSASERQRVITEGKSLFSSSWPLHWFNRRLWENEDGFADIN